MTDTVGAGELVGSQAERSEAGSGGEGGILARQRRDHAELEALMRRYELSSSPLRRASVFVRLSQRALRHAFAEETVLFPACRKHLAAEGDRLTAEIEDEHQAVNDLLAELQKADRRTLAQDPRVARVFALIRDDARREEDVLLPRLQRAAGPAELRRLGAAWEAARAAAPTRPHPRVSRRPPGNVLAAPVLTLRDRAAGAGPAWRTVGVGICAGLAGVAVMTLGEKLEQAVTGRADSHVPRKTLQALSGHRLGGRPKELRPLSDRRRFLLNHAMHWGTGVALGPVRALFAQRDVRGVLPSLAFGALRLSVDQTLENATGVGSPPPTWPRDELLMDVGHKLVYALVTGAVADRLTPSHPG